MKIILHNKPINTANEKTVVVGTFFNSDEKSTSTPSPFISSNCKKAKDLLKKIAGIGAFKGAKGSIYFYRSLDDGIPNYLFAGLGTPKEFGSECAREMAARISKRLVAEKAKDVALCLDSFLHRDVLKFHKDNRMMQGLTEGILLANYKFEKYKSKPSEDFFSKIKVYYSKKNKKINDAITTGTILADAVMIGRDLSNEPAGTIYPKSLGRAAEKLAKQYGIRCKVLQKAEIQKEKMGGLIGVGQGSQHPPTFIVLEYRPVGMKKGIKSFGLVGKAVTFDSGGISLKPGAKMEDMKHDMSGGANVIATILACAKLKLNKHVMVYVPAAENMPDGTAINPSTVLYTRSGITVEVQNTDAEGRLILCDAIDYAQDKKHDVLIDVATLTGAVVVALGNTAAGIMGNDQGVIDKFLRAAEGTGEKHWLLPLYPEYSNDMKSKVADLANIGNDRGAGSPKAGAFLKEFVKPGQKWLHIDIAGTAWGQNHLPYCTHGATGHGVRTMVQFIMEY